jgi:hypothetical protein
MNKFNNFYKKVITLFEMDSASVLGGSEQSGDYKIKYAEGDARVPFAIGAKKVGKKRKYPLIQKRNIK